MGESEVWIIIQPSSPSETDLGSERRALGDGAGAWRPDLRRRGERKVAPIVRPARDCDCGNTSGGARGGGGGDGGGDQRERETQAMARRRGLDGERCCVGVCLSGQSGLAERGGLAEDAMREAPIEPARAERRREVLAQEKRTRQLARYRVPVAVRSSPDASCSSSQLPSQQWLSYSARGPNSVVRRTGVGFCWVALF